MTKYKKAIIGLGNEYLGDDAVGIKIIDELVQYDFKDTLVTKVIDDSLKLIEIFQAKDLVIIIDAVKDKVQIPGYIYKLESEEVFYTKTKIPSFSSHTLDLIKVLELAKTLDSLPKQIIIYGIVGENFKKGDSMSEVVADAMGVVVNEIIKFFN